jgi:lipid-A-disaccharide synthase
LARIGIVAGEISGDLLGAGLVRALKERVPELTVEGIGGPRMEGEGCRSLYPMERLAVMGLSEVIGRVRELRRIQSGLVDHFAAHPPDVFIGVDAPDFNLTLERRLKQRGIKTVHYVSPSVWAWRTYRLRKIKRAVDHMLVLFPFEADFYKAQHIPVTFVGHPLADTIPLDVDQAAARVHVNLPRQGEVVAVLPGSRVTEVQKLAPEFIRAAVLCARTRPGLHFIAPMANAKVRDVFETALHSVTDAPPILLTDGTSREAMAAADVVLAAGGTAILEAMLLKRPVVMAYKIAASTYWLARRLVKIDTYALPNLLAGQRLVPEFIQDQANAAALAGAVLGYLERPEKATELRRIFTDIHRNLRRDADHAAARVILGMLREAEAALPALGDSDRGIY